MGIQPPIWNYRAMRRSIAVVLACLLGCCLQQVRGDSLLDRQAYALLSQNLTTSSSVACSCSPSSTLDPPLYLTLPSLANPTVFTSPVSLVAHRAFKSRDAARANDEFDSLIHFSAAGSGSSFRLQLLRYNSDPDVISKHYVGRFMNGSIYPSPRGWGSYTVDDESNEPHTVTYKGCVQNVSYGLLPVPYHSFFLLEGFYVSRETSSDVSLLSQYFSLLYDFHLSVHTRQSTFKVNVIHPFESTIPITSPFWPAALKAVIDGPIKGDGWLPDPLPPVGVTSSPDYPGDDVYFACLYLIDLLAACKWDVAKYLHRGGFGMLDAGFASAMSISDVALTEVSQILRQKGSNFNSAVSNYQVSTLQSWCAISSSNEVDSNAAIIDSLYNPLTRSYASKVYSNETKDLVFLDLDDFSASVADFYPLFSPYSRVRSLSDYLPDYNIPANRMEALAFNILDPNAPSTFSCSDTLRPMRSAGCNVPDDTPPSDDTPRKLQGSAANPLSNYLVFRGFAESDSESLASWIRNETLMMPCPPSTPINGTYESGPCNSSPSFSAWYSTVSQPHAVAIEGGCGGGMCGNTSAEAAGIHLAFSTYNDEAFTFISAPPLNNYWTLALISAELLVALGIGIMCLLLSIALMRKLAREETVDEYSLDGRGTFRPLTSDPDLNAKSGAAASALPRGTSGSAFSGGSFGWSQGGWGGDDATHRHSSAGGWSPAGHGAWGWGVGERGGETTPPAPASGRGGLGESLLNSAEVGSVAASDRGPSAKKVEEDGAKERSGGVVSTIFMYAGYLRPW